MKNQPSIELLDKKLNLISIFFERILAQFFLEKLPLYLMLILCHVFS